MADLAVNILAEYLERALKTEVTEKVRLLLETKHLYQSVAVEFSEVCKKVGVRDKDHKDLLASVVEAFYEFWFVRDRAKSASLIADSRGKLEVNIPDAKLYCQTCDRLEPFNCVSSSSLMDIRNDTEIRIGSNPRATQVLGLAFLCQSCKGTPEVFLVRRDNAKLTLCGRAPMEVVSVPNVIPKSVTKYYSGAVVAHQSGQTLAALFMFRTLLEQWARSQIDNPSDQADQIMDAYMEMLPPDFKSRFPSMRSLYGELSSDIHQAKGSAELFEKAMIEIAEHFDVRRLFRMTERVARQRA